MKNDRDSFRRASDKKSTSFNNNIVWFLLILGVLTFSAVSLLTSGNEEKLQYSDLLELAKVADGKSGNAWIDVQKGTPEKIQKVRYSDPSDIKIGSYEVTGRITELMASGRLFADLGLPPIGPDEDRGMICGSMAMLRDTREMLEGFGLVEGSNAQPGSFVVERAFVD